MVYVNTLMLQKVLAEPVWGTSLNEEELRGLTPLFYSHVNPYDEKSAPREETGERRPVQSRLVGRQAEWQQLRDLWERSEKGAAQAVLISGEAGIGKSQLVEEFERWVGRMGGLVVSTQLYASGGSLAYAPIIEWLRSEALRPIVRQMEDVWLVELERLLPELDTERPDLPQPQPMMESWQRQRLYESMARVIQHVEYPLLLVIDDLQWVDGETATWIQYLFSAYPDAPLLLAATFRAEEEHVAHPSSALRHDLRVRRRLTEIELAPLSETEAIALANQITDQELSAERLAKLYAESEGNPLFLVEMVRARLWEMNGDAPIESALSARSFGVEDPSLPPRIQAVIEERFSQLSASARALWQRWLPPSGKASPTAIPGAFVDSTRGRMPILSEIFTKNIAFYLWDRELLLHL